MIENRFFNQQLSSFNNYKTLNKQDEKNLREQETNTINNEQETNQSQDLNQITDLETFEAFDLVAQNNKLVMEMQQKDLLRMKNDSTILDNNNANNVKTVSGEGLTSLIQSFYPTYQNAYESVFAPNTQNFQTVFDSSQSFISTLYPSPVEVSESEVSADFNYVLRYNINEFLWNQHNTSTQSELTSTPVQTTNAPESRVTSRGVGDSDEELPSIDDFDIPSESQMVANLNGKTYTGKNGAIITINTNYTTDVNGNVIQDPSTFDSFATLTIKQPNGSESSIIVTTEDLNANNFENTLNQIISTIGELKETVLDDFVSEVMYIDVALDNGKVDDVTAGYYTTATNTITFLSNKYADLEVFVHELGHAVDNLGNDTFLSEKYVNEFENLKKELIEFCPSLANNYALSNVFEFFAELYACKHNGDSWHMGKLLKEVNEAIDMTEFSDEASQNKANALKGKFSDLVKKMSENLKTIREHSDAERIGYNLQYINDRVILNSLLKDKSIIKDYYEFGKANLIPNYANKPTIKEFLKEIYTSTRLVTLKRKLTEGTSTMGENMQKRAMEFFQKIENIWSYMRQNDILANNQISQTQQNNILPNQNDENNPSMPNINEQNFGDNNWNIPSFSDDSNSNDNRWNNSNTSSESNIPDIPKTPNLPDMGDLGFDAPDFSGYGSGETNVTEKTDTYTKTGNISEFDNNSFNPEGEDADLPSNASSMLQAQADAAAEAAANKARQEYGDDAQITTSTNVTIDENGNYSVEVTVTVKDVETTKGDNNTGNGQANIGGISDSGNSINGNGGSDFNSNSSSSDNSNGSGLADVSGSSIDDAKLDKVSDDVQANADLQAGLNWVNSTFTDGNGNFDGAGLADWANDNFGEGSAEHYTGTDAQDAWNNYINTGSFGSSSGGSSMDMSWSGFDVTQTGGGWDYEHDPRYMFGGAGGGGAYGIPQESDLTTKKDKVEQQNFKAARKETVD